jgi:cyclic pyranopterin phosphate synthase
MPSPDDPPAIGPVLDALRRRLGSLRVSVTDRCNLRCAYCMPEEEYRWLPDPRILSFEELGVLVDAFVRLGLSRVRLTGGEPLVRRDLPELVRQLAIRPLSELALTTNGVLLARHAAALKAAGLKRVTVSLDTLSPARFLQLTRRNSHGQVLEGLAEAHRVGFEGPLKLDTVVIGGVNDDELVPLLDFAARYQAEVRFIEYMDVGGATTWSMDKVFSRARMLERIAAALGAVEPLPGRSTAPAERFRLADGRTFGIIASTTQPFCRTCDRARLTADGHWYTCLYAASGLDLRAPLRAGATAVELADLIRGTWQGRADRGAEQRLDLRGHRGPLATAAQLRSDPRLEMHTRGG